MKGEAVDNLAAEAVRIVRLISNISQKDISDKLGVGSGTVCYIETGQRYVSKDLVGDVVELLGFDRKRFMDYIETGEGADYIRQFVLDAVTDKLDQERVPHDSRRRDQESEGD